MLSVLLHSIMGLVGGFIYMGIEILWRGHTHWTMGIIGGLCFLLIGLLDEWQEHPPIILQMVQGALIVTAIEFCTGLIVNLWLGWDVWNYCDMPFNLLGQVCLPFSIAWFFLSAVAVWAENAMHFLCRTLTVRWHK